MVPQSTFVYLVDEKSQSRGMKIFISHKQVDSAAIAEKLFYTLERLGHQPWLDVNMPDRSLAGMEKGVREAGCVIAIVSSNYFTAKFCLGELHWAQEYQVPVVPVISMDDKKKVGEFIALCPEEFKVKPRLAQVPSQMHLLPTRPRTC